MQELSQLVGLTATLTALTAALICLVAAVVVLLLVSKLSARLLKFEESEKAPPQSRTGALDEAEAPLPQDGKTRCPTCKAVLDTATAKIAGVNVRDGQTMVSVECSACKKPFELANEQAQQLIQPAS